ncbi:hypothetical protein Bca52824_024139 [Brassica carinata]|uniref:Uncharacterized protein n=1 Tax=Brassica carinata TaxID=52824 RepID=A0A8X8AWF1_BRACI|nr:hypothetical protein Bca52824_024139 [Brassica carinata]
MDKHTDARNLLGGKVVPLRLGYVGVSRKLFGQKRNSSKVIQYDCIIFEEVKSAFIGNEGLCGPPLKDLCEGDNASYPFIPSNNRPDDNQMFCACNIRDRHSKKRATECLCFRKDESETLSENMEHCDIVALDAQEAFNLEKLLKALQLDLALPAT